MVPWPSTWKLSRGDAAAGLAACPIGIIAGITGVGGAEYRAPVLLLLLHNIRWTITANLLAGVVVVAFLVWLRGSLSLPLDVLSLSGTMILSSIPGAYAGAVLARRTSGRWLKVLLGTVLVATALRLLLIEAVAQGTFFFGATEAALALLVGFGIGVISGLLGVAGGEYRIPAFILVFGLPPVAAGTASALVSLPQQVVGFLKHRQLGQAPPRAVRLGAIMGIVGAAGVTIGVALIQRTNDATITRILALLMLMAAARIMWEAREPDPKTAAGPP